MPCFDTDVLAAVLLREPPMHLVRRLARTPASDQCTTAVSLAEVSYAVARNGDPDLVRRLQESVAAAQRVIPFDADAAGVYGLLRADLERRGRRLDEPSLRIASIVLAHDLTLVTGRAGLYRLVPGLRIENWLEPEDTAEEAAPEEETAPGRSAPTTPLGERDRRPADGVVRHPGMLRSLGARVSAAREAQREEGRTPTPEDVEPDVPRLGPPPDRRHGRV